MIVNGRDYMTYEELLMAAEQDQVLIKEKPLRGSDGRIYKNRIAIRKDIPTSIQKACTLAEELGHYHTTTGDILDMSNANHRKQELHARLYAYNRLIGLTGLVAAAKAGCKNRYETAEFLNVTEEFLQEAIDCYTSKYGTGVMLDNYWITFEPTLQIHEYLCCSTPK